MYKIKFLIIVGDFLLLKRPSIYLISIVRATVSDCYDLNCWERLVLWADGIREPALVTRCMALVSSIL